MPSRSLAVWSALLAVTSLAGASSLHAQTTSAPRFHHDVSPVSTPAPQVIHCGPAPLTERPGIQWEFSRPHVAPLELALAENAKSRRSMAALRIPNQR